MKLDNLGMDAHFSCPICGHGVELRHHSPLFDLDMTGQEFNYFFKGDGVKRKGICKQLNEQGEDWIIHFVVIHGGRASHRLWVKQVQK